MQKTRLYQLFLLLLVAAAMSVTAFADSITILTPSGSSAGGQAVSASALVTTGAGTVTITLTDAESNPKSVSQLISGFDFQLSNGATTGTLVSSSAQQITINGSGAYTLGSTGSTGWGLNNNVGGGLQIDALGFSAPGGLIIGAPGSGGTYSNANASILNGSHDPFLTQSATFTLDVAGVTAHTAVTNAFFSFGSTSGSNIVALPEPTTLLLLATGLLVLIAIGSRRQLRPAWLQA